jgi:membrane protein YdbS with pleckstrin-like domain
VIEGLKRLAVRALRVPGEPHDPEGAPGSLIVLRPGVGYFKARLYGWLAFRVLVAIWTLMAGGLVCLLVLGVLAAARAEPVRRAAGRHASLFDKVDEGTVWTVGLSCLAVAGVFWLAHTLFSYATMRLDYELRWYKVTDRSLRIREGIWFVREMTMSFANIQNLSITQGPIQKLFGVSDLRVESAGGGGAAGQPGVIDLHVGWFRGIERAEEVKALMLTRLRERGRTGDAGLGDHEDEARALLSGRGRGLSPGALAALREAREEAARLRTVAQRS